jgi:hypothetical protein
MSGITISDHYLEQQKRLHLNPNYGVASLCFAPVVAKIIKATGCKSVSDYGAGKRRLTEGLGKEGLEDLTYFPYDPVFPEYGPAKAADLVCCIDVLEHIEPELIDNVLDDLHGITRNLGFFSIHMGPAAKVLDDGRNAHLTQEPASWWLKRITNYFEVHHLETHNMMGRGFWVIISRKKEQ